MIFVGDDIFTDIELNEVYQKYNNHKSTIPLSWIGHDAADQYVQKLSSIASKFIEISTSTGFEVWSQYNTRTGWHYDKNEHKFNTTGELEYPLCSIIFYPYVDSDLIGGELHTDIGIKISPKTNRIIIMSPGVMHVVNDYKGERFSLLVNPWERNVVV